MKKAQIELMALLIFTPVLYFIGIKWGLPSSELNHLYFSGPQSIETRVEAFKEYQLKALLDNSDKKMPRSWYNPIRSYHPDEYFVLKNLAGMNPKKMDLNPKQFSIGGAYLYPMGAVLFLLSRLRLIHLSHNLDYYFFHPEEFAKFYLVGRLITSVFGVGVIWLTYLLASLFWKNHKAGLLAGIFTALVPLIVLNCHYMYVDIPGLFWIMAGLCFGVRYLQSGPFPFAPFLLGGVTGLAAGTKMTFLSAFLIPLSTFFLYPGISIKERIRDVSFSFLAFSGLFLLTNPYIFEVFPLLLTGARENAVPSAFSPVIFYLKALGFGLGLPLVLFVLAGIAFIVYKRAEWTPERSLLILWCFCFFIFISRFSLNFARYILPIIPPLIVLGVGFWTVPSRIKFINIAKRLLPIFIMVVTFFYGMAYLSLFWKENARTLAGRWIKENLPPETDLGLTEVPWQFQMAPLDEERYHLTVTGYNFENMVRLQPDYFILSSFQAGIPPVPDQMPPERARFWEEFQTAQIYQPFISFNQPLSFLGIRFNQNGVPEDFIYPNPTITIFKKRR